MRLKLGIEPTTIQGSDMNEWMEGPLPSPDAPTRPPTGVLLLICIVLIGIAGGIWWVRWTPTRIDYYLGTLLENPGG